MRLACSTASLWMFFEQRRETGTPVADLPSVDGEHIAKGQPSRPRAACGQTGKSERSST